MNETLLQKIEKLEEKMMQLLTQHEESRNEIQCLTAELIALKTERETHEKKLTDLLSLIDTAGFDTVNTVLSTTGVATGATLAPIAPIKAFQG